MWQSVWGRQSQCCCAGVQEVKCKQTVKASSSFKWNKGTEREDIPLAKGVRQISWLFSDNSASFLQLERKLIFIELLLCAIVSIHLTKYSVLIMPLDPPHNSITHTHTHSDTSVYINTHIQIRKLRLREVTSFPSWQMAEIDSNSVLRLHSPHFTRFVCLHFSGAE